MRLNNCIVHNEISSISSSIKIIMSSLDFCRHVFGNDFQNSGYKVIFIYFLCTYFFHASALIAETS